VRNASAAWSPASEVGHGGILVFVQVSKTTPRFVCAGQAVRGGERLRRARPTRDGLQEPAGLFPIGTGRKATLTHRGNPAKRCLRCVEALGLSRLLQLKASPGSAWGHSVPSPALSPPHRVPRESGHQLQLKPSRNRLMHTRRTGVKGQSPLWTYHRASELQSQQKCL